MLGNLVSGGTLRGILGRRVKQGSGDESSTQLGLEVMQRLVLIVSLVALVGVVSVQSSIKSTDTDAESRAEQAMGGFFNYYWKQDPVHKDISFFFACGEIGNLGVSSLDQCSCANPDTCVNCYRWWSAVALESIATYGIYMNTSNHSAVADMIFDHSAYNANWQPENAFIDDFLWYGITYLRVYEWLKVMWLSRMFYLGDMPSTVGA